MILFTDIHGINKSFWYPYPKDSKISEDILLIGELAGLCFEYEKVIDFYIVEHIAIETNETPAKNIIGWLKNDSDDSWYKHLRIMVLMLILK